MKAAMTVFMVCFLLMLSAGNVSPQTQGNYYVSLQGDDGNAGTLASPWKTIASSIAKLRPGDTLNIRAGTYFESPRVGVNGVEGAPMTIQSYPGEQAVIDSGLREFRTPGNNDWELVNEALGEYRSVKSYPSGGTIWGYITGIPGYRNERITLVPYKSAAAFRATTDQYVNGSTDFYIGPGTFYDPTDGRIHIRLAKTSDVMATEARYGTIFTTRLPDPRHYGIILSRASQTLSVTGSYITFKNIIVNQAQKTITLSGNAHHVTFEGMTVWMGYHSIYGSGSSVYNITVTRSKIYGDNPYWIFWSDIKNAPAPADNLRNTAITMYSGTHDWEISWNHIRGSGQDLISVNNNEYNVSIHHNRIEQCGDDAIELEGSTNVGRVSIFENYIANCLVALAPGQDTANFSGPLFVYRNVFALLQNQPVNRKAGINSWNGGGRFGFEYMFKQNGSSFATKNAFYYHNTMVMLGPTDKGLNITPQNPQNTRIANNIMVMVNGLVNRAYPSSGMGAVVDGNLYWKVNPVDSARLLSNYDTVPAFNGATGFEVNGLGDLARRGTDPKFVGVTFNVSDPKMTTWEISPISEFYHPGQFFLANDSPAIGKGIVIPPHPVYGALPDTRKSRDIGAFPRGTNPAEYSMFPFVPGSPPISPPPTATPPTATPPSVAPPTATPTRTLTPTPVPTSPAGATTMTSQVKTSTDDVEETVSNGSMYISSSDLEFTADGSTIQTIGMRFQGISVPGRSVITNAYIEFVAKETQPNSTNLTLYGQAIDNAPTFTTSAYNVSSRAKTAASIPWSNIPVWSVEASYQTPNLAPIIQEIVNRPGWASGNALVVIVTGTGHRTAYAYGGSSAKAPKLVITYK